MKKALFLLNYRGGSSLFNLLNGCHTIYSIHEDKDYLNPFVFEEDRIVNIEGINCTPHSFWMATIPYKTCISEHLYSYNPEQITALDLNIDLFSWYGNVGDWWGEVKSHSEVPEPYTSNTFYRFGPEELISLGEDWSFVYLSRDPRNQIESLYNVRGGYEESKRLKDPRDYFQVLCKGSRNRMRMAIDCKNKLQNFKLFYFEDLIKNPVEVMKLVYDFLDLDLNKTYVENSYKFSLDIKKTHSSFGSTKKVNKRWLCWTDWKKDLFKEIVGQELIELGYEKDHNW